MHVQKLKRPPMKPLAGLLTVLGVLAALVLSRFLTQLLAPAFGQGTALIVFWLVGLGIALIVLRRFVLSYEYLLSPTLLRVCFAYGRYVRVMADLYLNNILFTGSEAEAKKRWPGARVNRAALPGAGPEPLAVVCMDGGKPAIYILQPDDEIRAQLTRTKRK